VIGTLEGAYTERLQAGDRFVLDGRALEFRRLEGLTVHAKSTGGEPNLPRWSSDRQGLSAELARDVARFRARAAEALTDGPSSLRAWLGEDHDIGPDEAGVLEALFAAQEQLSEIPGVDDLLVEEYPDPSGVGFVYAFHAPLGRAASEALARASAARLGRRFGRDLKLVVADLGWSLTLPEGARIGLDDLPSLLDPEGFEDDVLDGLDQGELLSRRFRHIAATALMVLRRPEGGRTRVGGLLWVSQRLYPLVKAACPDHPLLRETRREVLKDTLDTPTALEWLETRPTVRFRSIDGVSPFASAWIDPGAPEALRFESPGDALRRLHERLVPR
jgi:ATP-dependent helicase Lhr and Lhr-like helicase